MRLLCVLGRLARNGPRADDSSSYERGMNESNQSAARVGARRLERERRTVEAMITLYCRAHHRPMAGRCADCEALAAYAQQRLARCRFGAQKPTCGRCPIHCYAPAMRERIRAVMRYAGPRMLWHHPGLAFCHLVDALRSRLVPSVWRPE